MFAHSTQTTEVLCHSTPDTHTAVLRMVLRAFKSAPTIGCLLGYEYVCTSGWSAAEADSSSNRETPHTPTRHQARTIFVDHAPVWCVVEIYRRLLLSVLIDAQNTAANHGFLSRDGIVTFAELTDAQQNVYGVGYDLAVLLAVLGVGLDGDPITTKLSLGCDATSRTATPGLGPEGGLSTHNKFEGDTSLTRNDFYLANGDNFRFNRTLYNMMSQTTGGLHNRKILPLQDRSDRPWLIASSR